MRIKKLFYYNISRKLFSDVLDALCIISDMVVFNSSGIGSSNSSSNSSSVGSCMAKKSVYKNYVFMYFPTFLHWPCFTFLIREKKPMNVILNYITFKDIRKGTVCGSVG